MAANMSTSSAMMVDSGALFTQSFYRKLVPERPDRHYLWIGRVSGFAITMIGVLYALFVVESVLYSFLLTETLATYMGISFLGGILWRRANRWGALSSLVVAMITNFALYALRGERLDHWDPSVFLISLAAGFAALVVTSLATRPEPAPANDAFFERLQTPEPGDTGPEDRSLLVNLLHPRRGAGEAGMLRAYRTDLLGFGLGVALAVALVAATAWLLSL
jgi:Na+/proline symporter